MRLIPVIVLAAAFGPLAGCSKKQSAPPKESVPVSVASASVKDVPVQVTAIGHVEAYATVSLKAQVGGELIKVGFKEGQDVSQGDLLFLIDPRPFEATLAQARANLERDRARAKNAEEDARRYGSLVQKDYATPQQFDEMRSNAAAAAPTARPERAAAKRRGLQRRTGGRPAPSSSATASWSRPGPQGARRGGALRLQGRRHRGRGVRGRRPVARGRPLAPGRDGRRVTRTP